MILRRAAIAYFAIAALCSSVYGAELTLESREIPSPQVTGQRALRLIEIFEQLAVGPPQHMAIADLLRPIPGLREAAETAEAIFMLEPKAGNQMDDPIVLAKKEVAVKWCANASTHARSYDGKPWRYLLIPHEEIVTNTTLAALAARFGTGFAVADN